MMTSTATEQPRPVEPSASRAGWILALAAILLLGLGLRIAGIARESLWTDEALTLTIAQWSVRDMLTRPIDPTPLLYYTLHKWLIPASGGLAAVRSISLVAGMLGLVAIHAAARLAFRRPSSALLAAALAAVSAPLIDYSQEARAYSLLVLLVMVSAASLLWWFAEVERARPRRRLAILLFVVATALSLYTHFVAIFWVAPAALILFLGSRGAARRIRDEAVLAITALIVLLLPEAIRLVKARSAGTGFTWLDQASPAEFARLVGEAFLPSLSAAAMLVLAWIAVRLVMLRRELRHWASDHPPSAAVIATLLLSPPAMWLFGYLVQPIVMPRTLLIAIPGFILLVTLLVELDRLPRARLVTSAGLVLVYLGAVLAGGTVRPKEPWRAVASALAERVEPGDLVLVCPNWKYPALRHAVTRAVPAPGISLRNGAVLVEPRFGASADWPRLYLDAMNNPRSHRPVLGGWKRAWLVASECEPSSRAKILRLLGGGGSRAWIAPARGEHRQIAIWRFDPPRR